MMNLPLRGAIHLARTFMHLRKLQYREGIASTDIDADVSGPRKEWFLDWFTRDY